MPDRDKIRELGDERLHELEKRFAATGGGDTQSPVFEEIARALQQGVDKGIDDAHPTNTLKSQLANTTQKR